MPQRRLPEAVSNVVAFLVMAGLFFGISWLKQYLRAERPLGLPTHVAPYVAYGICFALLGVGMGWHAARLERAESRRPVDTRLLFAICIGGCALVGLFLAWLFG